MAFAWADFLALARRLSSGNEAERRTAVSRAYYAAFNVAKEWANGHGFAGSSGGPASHWRVWDHLRLRPDPGEPGCLRPTQRIVLERLGTEKHAALYEEQPSLTEVLLVSQSEARIEQYVRQPDDRWLLSEIHGSAGILSLPSLGCDLPLAEVYAKVSLEMGDAEG